MAGLILKTGFNLCRRLALLENLQQRAKLSKASKGGAKAKKPFMDIECKVALITGGYSGIGLGIANELLKKGAKVVAISGSNNQKGEEAMGMLNDTHGGGRCIYMNLNTKNGKQFEDVFKAVFLKYGSLDILVNNAGVLNDKAWEDTIAINMNGVIRGILLGHKYMPTCNKPKGGVVVNIGSTYSFDTLPYAPIYNMTKHGVIGLTRSFGDKFHSEETGVRVIALCPGVTKTKHIEPGNGEMLTDEWTEKAYAAMSDVPQQTVDATSRAAVHIIKHAESGSCWPVEAHVLYKAQIPDRKSYSAKVLEL